MYLLWILHALYGSVVGEFCENAFGAFGLCEPIRSCPQYLWIFANPRYKVDQYLKKFLCPSNELGLRVCCERRNEGELVHESNQKHQKLANARICGVNNNDLEKDGNVVHLQNFPWLVKIMKVENPDNKNRIEKVACTGVLINNLYVLFSAQCHHTNLVNSNNFVRIDTYLDNEEICETQSYLPQCSSHENYEIDAITIHPFYDPITNFNNMGILRLSRRIQFSDYVQPICLPTTNGPDKIGEILETAGWNKTFGANDVSVKLSQSSTLISNTDCTDKTNWGKNITVSSYEICTRTEEDNRNMDVSGFSLMSLRQDGQWYLQGFMSQGTNIKIYTRVQKYLFWIEETMGGEQCLTPNNEAGECMHLSDCPKLLDAFTNPLSKEMDTLRKFVCEYNGEDPSDKNYILKVCCVSDRDFGIFSDLTYKGLDLKVSNFKFCGLQHVDEYVTTSRDGISADEFPWLAIFLNVTVPEQRDVVCAGSVITQNYVLTSAQCSVKLQPSENIVVRLGDSYIASKCVEKNKEDCDHVQEYGIEETITHPFYNEFTLMNNIALLRLSQPIGFSDFIRPICLPRSEKDLADSNSLLFTTGFGNTIKGEKQKIKKKIGTTLIDNNECKVKLKALSYITPITPYHVCTENFTNSTDVNCIGDEGGPVMHSKRLQWFIEGIISSYSCGNDEPQTYVRVYKYLHWIRLSIKD